jgi:hypothetical protein
MNDESVVEGFQQIWDALYANAVPHTMHVEDVVYKLVSSIFFFQRLTVIMCSPDIAADS